MGPALRVILLIIPHSRPGRTDRGATARARRWQTSAMHARSAVFDLYGDHLRTRGDAAPVAAVIRILDPIGIAAPAVRTAISRMVSQGWLAPVSLPNGRGYAATPQARQRLGEALSRIYGRTRSWDGAWHVLVTDGPSGRTARQRLRSDLEFLGYARFAADTWISPHPSGGVADVLARAQVSATTATLCDVDPPHGPLTAWDLESLRRTYEEWLETVDALVEAHLAQHTDPDEASFAAHFHLVHEWRKFLFTDPGLPESLLPDDWPGLPAAAVFDRHAAALRPAADRFVGSCLG